VTREFNIFFLSFSRDGRQGGNLLDVIKDENKILYFINIIIRMPYTHLARGSNSSRLLRKYYKRATAAALDSGNQDEDVAS